MASKSTAVGLHENDVILEKDPNTKCTVNLFGATLISWICKGEEYIFLSSLAKFDHKSAIRGGIPIVFPCFGPWSCGPQHGFARNTSWVVEKHPYKDDNGNDVASFILSENANTLEMWNYKFKLIYTVTLSEHSLTTALSVVNNDLSSFDFTCLLHTYFRVPDVSVCTVSSLKGLTYADNTEEGKMKTEDRELLSIDRFIDYTYADTPTIHNISAVTGSRTMRLEKSNFPDTVIWNPWKEKGSQMSDLDRYDQMLCVEAGHVTRSVELAPGATYEAFQTLTIIDA